ncbi:MAG: LytTR family transcriptional regulator [Cyclobacteriaceae bacterium]
MIEASTTGILDAASKDRKESTSRDSYISDHIFIPDNYEYVKVRLDEILYIEADGSYIKIQTLQKTFQLSTNLKNFNEQFDHPQFFRVSRKHIINLTYTERINGIALVIKGPDGVEHKIPFSKRKRHNILARLPVIKIRH